jgi:hypothetical protein
MTVVWLVTAKVIRGDNTALVAANPLQYVH